MELYSVLDINDTLEKKLLGKWVRVGDDPEKIFYHSHLLSSFWPFAGIAKVYDFYPGKRFASWGPDCKLQLGTFLAYDSIDSDRIIATLKRVSPYLKHLPTPDLKFIADLLNTDQGWKIIRGPEEKRRKKL